MESDWAEEGLFPATMIGFFSWWTWSCFLLDLWGGVWGRSYWGSLDYYSGSDNPYGIAIPTMIRWITFGAALFAIISLSFLKIRAWSARVLKVISLCAVLASTAYVCIVAARENIWVNGTQQFIHNLETTKRELGELDRKALDDAKAALEAYQKAKR